MSEGSSSSGGAPLPSRELMPGIKKCAKFKCDRNARVYSDKCTLHARRLVKGASKAEEPAGGDPQSASPDTGGAFASDANSVVGVAAEATSGPFVPPIGVPRAVAAIDRPPSLAYPASIPPIGVPRATAAIDRVPSSAYPASSAYSPNVHRQSLQTTKAGAVDSSSTSAVTRGLCGRQEASAENEDAAGGSSDSGADSALPFQGYFQQGTDALVRWFDDSWYECVVGSVNIDGTHGTLCFPPTKGCSPFSTTSIEVDFEELVASANLKRKRNDPVSPSFWVLGGCNKLESPGFAYFPGLEVLSDVATKVKAKDG